MAVTEYATVRCTAASLVPELKDLLIQGYKVQDKWCDDNESGPRSRHAGLFQQVEDPTVVLLTARWDSITSHGRWIESEVNKKVMERLTSGHIETEGDKGVVLLHLDGEIFAEYEPSASPGEDAVEHLPLISSPIISVERMFVAPAQKDVFADRFEQVKGELAKLTSPGTFRGAWRVDKRADEEEFVLFCGWEVADQSARLANSSSYAELSALTRGSDRAHYRRFL